MATKRSIALKNDSAKLKQKEKTKKRKKQTKKKEKMNMHAYNTIHKKEWISNILGNESVVGDGNSILGIKEDQYTEQEIGLLGMNDDRVQWITEYD